MTIPMTLTALVLSLFATLPTRADGPSKGDCKDHHCPEPPKIICLNVFCTYRAEGDAHHAEKCEAGAVFKKLVKADGEEVFEDSEQPFNPLFEVACNKLTLFNGSAHRYTDSQGTRLQAEIGPFPAVVLPRGALREGHRYEPSVLELGNGEALRGFCFIYTGPQLQ